MHTSYPPFSFDQTLSPALNGIPFVDSAVGVLVFAATALLKDTVNCIDDLLDGWVAEQDLQGLSGTTNAGDCTGGR